MSSSGAAVAGVALIVAFGVWLPWFAWPAARSAWRWARTWPLGPGPLRLRERRLCFALAGHGYAATPRPLHWPAQCTRVAEHYGLHVSPEGVWWPAR